MEARIARFIQRNKDIITIVIALLPYVFTVLGFIYLHLISLRIASLDDRLKEARHYEHKVDPKPIGSGGGTQSLEGRCDGNDLALSYKLVPGPVTAAYVQSQELIQNDRHQVGFKVIVWNGAGSERPTGKVGMQVQCLAVGRTLTLAY
jgi:hypothetical protein